jgi:hypothetical protein
MVELRDEGGILEPKGEGVSYFYPTSREKESYKNKDYRGMGEKVGKRLTWPRLLPIRS